MKKSLFASKKVEEEAKEYYQRQKRKWECIRRNKNYIEDFRQYGNRTLSNDEGFQMLDKWDLWNLPDPTKPIARPQVVPGGVTDYPMGYPYPDYPYKQTRFFADFAGSSELPGRIVHPGESLKVRIHGQKSSKVVEKKMEGWGIINSKNKTIEKLSADNCPRSVSIHIEIEPWFPKGMVEDALMEAFERAFEEVRTVQKAIAAKKYHPHFDENDFQRILDTYDFKTQNPPVPLSEIAIKLFPEETQENRPHKRKAQKPVLPESSAKEKVKYYWGVAKKLIDKNGWRYL